MVCIEATEELGLGEEASPTLANGRGVWEGGRLRWEAEEDLPEEIFVFEQRGQRHQ